MTESHHENLELDATRWLDDHGDVLFRYALRRVTNCEVAEDLVQETFVAAIRGKEQFEGRANVQNVASWNPAAKKSSITSVDRPSNVRRRGFARNRNVK